MAKLIGIICPHPDHIRLAIVLPRDVSTVEDVQRKIMRLGGIDVRTGEPIEQLLRASHG